MKFIGTRDHSAKEYTFEEAILTPGYLSDGGLLMPQSIPSVSLELLQSWSSLSLPGLCKEILPLFIDDQEIDSKELAVIIDDAYSKLPSDVAALASFPGGFNVLQLGNTKTLAFKDLSTFVVGRIMQYFLKKRKCHATALVGTSGDTGPSSIEAIQGLECMDIVVLLPHGYCSPIQELQMTTVIQENVHVFSVDGSSDDLDLTIRSVSVDQDFKTRHNLVTFNSINLSRVLCQMAMYFYGYLQVCKTVGETVEIIVPTGGAGSVTSGCIAQRMGLPIKLVCSVNSNDFMLRLLVNGEFAVAPEVIPTYSVAMDIKSPYNVERIFWLFSNSDSRLICEIMKEFEKNGRATLPDNLLSKMQEILTGYSCDDNGIIKAMKRCWLDHSYRICPHTAVAVSYFHDKVDRNAGSVGGEHNQPSVCLSSAHPAKFPDALIAAGIEPKPTPYIQSLSSLPTSFTKMKQGDDWEKMLREKIEDIYTRVTKSH